MQNENIFVYPDTPEGLAVVVENSIVLRNTMEPRILKDYKEEMAECPRIAIPRSDFNFLWNIEKYNLADVVQLPIAYVSSSGELLLSGHMPAPRYRGCIGFSEICVAAPVKISYNNAILKNKLFLVTDVVRHFGMMPTGTVEDAFSFYRNQIGDGMFTAFNIAVSQAFVQYNGWFSLAHVHAYTRASFTKE